MVQSLNGGKSPGIDNVPAELLKQGNAKNDKKGCTPFKKRKQTELQNNKPDQPPKQSHAENNTESHQYHHQGTALR